MPALRQSFSWWCFNKQNPKTFFKEVRNLGYAGIELVPHELWDEARAAGLEIVADMLGPIEQSLNRRENHARFHDQLAAKLVQAAPYKIPYLVCFSGNRAGLCNELGIANTTEALRAAAPIAARHNVTLLLELLNSHEHPDYHGDRTHWGIEVCKQVAASNVKILYDIYHMQIMEGNLISTIRQNIQHIGHFHTAGVPGRNELDHTQEINYPAVLQAIYDTGYRGYIGHEFIPRGDALAGLAAAFAVTSQLH